MRLTEAAKVLALVCCTSPALGAKPVTVDDVTLMTEEYPPYNFTDSSGELKGIAVDVMVLMLEKLHSKQTRKDIAVLPWVRGYKTVQQKSNSCLFTMAGTKARSKLFKFVGPLEKFDSAAMFAKKSRRISIQSYEDLKAYKIGVLRYDIAQSNLAEHGVSAHVVDISSSDSLAKMLDSGRIDLWAFGEKSVSIILRKNNINPDEIENVFSLRTEDSYYAFNPDTPDALVKQFQRAYNELTSENRIKPIITRYLEMSGPSPGL